jgi:predicted RNase H-like HicB family nuclease/uncharacterized damage-inducible protein DinB
MKTYSLSLESGPRRRTTYVHVPDLLGCHVRGPTTDEALDLTPDAIRAYLRFLQRHGEAVDPAEPFATEVAEHVTEGYFLGNGTMTIQADHQPLSAAEVDRGARWLEWALEETHQCVSRLIADQPPAAALDSAPDGARSVRAILQHMIGAEREYLRATFGGWPEINAVAKAAEKNEGDPLELLSRARRTGVERLRAMTPDERALSRQSGQQIWTARKMLRRMLEHGWEHLSEIAHRVEA